MKRCDIALEELSAFVDGELDAAGELELRRHLDVCSRCTQFVAGLAHLKGLAKLRRLYLSGTQVSDAGVKNLQRALPTCWITLRKYGRYSW